MLLSGEFLLVDEGCGLGLLSGTIFDIETYIFLNLRFINANPPSGGKKSVKVLIL